MNAIITLLVTMFIVLVEISVSFNSTLLPNLRADFFISEQTAQMTISIGLIALGFSGILYGLLADSIGRRPIFLFCVSLFSIGALTSSLATNSTVFFISRFIQGVASGAGWIIGNACLKDIWSGKSYIKIMNYVHAAAGIVPAVAPVVGSIIAQKFGWRICFQVLAALAFLTVLLMFFLQKETLNKKTPVIWGNAWEQFLRLFHNRNFNLYLAIKVIPVILLFTEISNIPLIFVEHMGVQPNHYGYFILPVFLCYVFSTLVSSYLANYFKIDTLIEGGCWLMVASNVLVVLLNPGSAVVVQILKSLTYFGWGAIFGNATAQVLNAANSQSGLAAAVMISFEVFFSALGIYFLSLFFSGSILPLSYFMLVLTVVMIFLLRKTQV